MMVRRGNAMKTSEREARERRTRGQHSNLTFQGDLIKTAFVVGEDQS